MRVQHFDRISIRWDASTLRTNADKTRTIDGFGAHVGPYTYHDDKGQPFIEQVPAETLFDRQSLDSAAGSTVTIRHGPGLVGPAQYRAEAHGAWVKAWDAGGGKLGVRVRLGSQEALDFVDKAIADRVSVELSPVYEVDVVEQSDAGGKTELVQKDREYSGIAMLGPDEARGGPGTRLQLDGPECAPAGARIQVRTPRLDSARRVPLHSNPTGPTTMKHVLISNGGRRRTISADTLATIRAFSVTTKKDALNADQIAVGRVLVEIEGEEPVDLMLPVAMIEMLLEGIGAGPSTAAPAPAEEPIAEEVALEAADAGDEETDKLDAKTVRKMIADALGKRDRKLLGDSARRSSINADAATILPAGYDYGVHWAQVCLDAIAKVDPKAEAPARALSTKAIAGDAVAEGRLRQMLADRRSDPGGPTPTAKPDSTADQPPWAATAMPEIKQ